MNDRQWRDRLRGHFADFERPEPEGLWDGIERAMASGRQAGMGAAYLRGRMLRRGGRVAAVAAVTAVALWIGGIVLRPDRPDIETGSAPAGHIAENPSRPEVPTPETATELAHAPETTEPARSREPTPTITPRRSPQPTPDIRTMVSGTGAAGGADMPEKPIPGDDVVERTHAGIPGEGPTAKKSPASETRPAAEKSPASKNDRPAAVEKSRQATDHNDNRDVFARNEPVRPHRPAWSARIVASGIPGSGSKGQSRGYGTLSSSTPQYDAAPVYAMPGENALTDIMILNRNTKTHTEARHNPPVRAGVLLSYGLTERLSVESGLTYAFLGSRLRSGSEAHYYETRQSLHYLGIPAKLNYSLWRGSRLRAYLSGGGMVERDIAGSASTEYTDGGTVFSKENRRVNTGRVQWSVNASAGLQYDLSHRVGIFADPGVSYHFDNGGTVETVYRKNPLNFDLTLGLRISFE